MSCIWNIKPEERQCGYCAVEYCSQRMEQSETISTTNQGLVTAKWSNASIIDNGNRLNN